MQQGLANQCEVVRGNFLEMPFEPNTFDAAYAIEATCHAGKVRGQWRGAAGRTTPRGVHAVLPPVVVASSWRIWCHMARGGEA